MKNTYEIETWPFTQNFQGDLYDGYIVVINDEAYLINRLTCKKPDFDGSELGCIVRALELYNESR